jgi:hypothetical protein
LLGGAAAAASGGAGVSRARHQRHLDRRELVDMRRLPEAQQQRQDHGMQQGGADPGEPAHAVPAAVVLRRRAGIISPPSIP